jgi:hypothetical protein
LYQVKTASGKVVPVFIQYGDYKRIEHADGEIAKKRHLQEGMTPEDTAKCLRTSRSRLVGHREYWHYFKTYGFWDHTLQWCDVEFDRNGKVVKAQIYKSVLGSD